MPLYSDHISNMYYSGTPAYSAPFSYSSSVLPLSSYSASYLHPGGSYSNHSSIGGYRKPISSRWVTSSGRNYAPLLGTISERASGSPVRINSPRRIPLTKRTYVAPSYVPRPININTADIDVSRDKYRYKTEKTPPQSPRESPVKDNGPFMPRVDGKPETGIDSSPGAKKSTIRRGRTVVRLHTVKRKERDSPRKPQVSEPEVQPLVAELTQVTNDDGDVTQVEPESLGWREKLAEELAYKDKREKKTLGAKLVEKFIVKDSDNDSSTKEIKLSNDSKQSLSAPSEPMRAPSRSPDRRCSIEMLAEQANLLDSLIRGENLSTAPLDLSKVGIDDEQKFNTEDIPSIKRRRSREENTLQTTKSDYSLHESLNSFRDPRDPKHFSKRRSLKKSMSGGSICRLDSIKEFPGVQLQIESEMPMIEENRLSIKRSKKPVPKMKAVITSSSVDISEPLKSPLKFKVDDVVVEEKIRSPRKDITYTVAEEPLLVVETIPSTSRANSILGMKKKQNLAVTMEEEQSVSPEPDDGNFWDKIGKRETVYLMRRKENLAEAKAKNRRALFWFPEAEETDDANPETEGNTTGDNIEDTNITTQHQDIVDSMQKDNSSNKTNIDLKSTPGAITENLNFEENQSIEYTKASTDDTILEKDKNKNSAASAKIDYESIRLDKNVDKVKDLTKSLVQDHKFKIPETKNVIETKLVRMSPDKCKSEFTKTENAQISLPQKKIELPENNTLKLIDANKISTDSSKVSQENAVDVAAMDQSLLEHKSETKEIKTTAEEKKISPKRNVEQKNKVSPEKKKSSPEKKKDSPKKNIKSSSKSDSDKECKCKKKSIKKIQTKGSPTDESTKVQTKTSPTDKSVAKAGGKKILATVDKLNNKSKVDSLNVKATVNTLIAQSTADLVQKDATLQNKETPGPSKLKTENEDKKLTQKSGEEVSNKVDEVTNGHDISKVPNSLLLPESEHIPNKQNESRSELLDEQEKAGEDNKAENNYQKQDNGNKKQPSEKEVVPLPKPIRKPVKEELALRPLIATPRPLQKKVPQVIHSSSSSESSSEEDSSSDDDADESDASEESTEFYECESNPDGRTSTGSNDSGFDSSAPTSPAGFVHIKKDCDVNCHRKCEKLTANLCGVNQKLLVEALASRTPSKRGAEPIQGRCLLGDSKTPSPLSVSRISNRGQKSVARNCVVPYTYGTIRATQGGDSPGPSSAPAQPDAAGAAGVLEQELEQSTAYGLFKKTGRFTPPARTIPRFKKYNIEDFHFIKVLGKGSFGKVLLTELRDTEYYYAVKCLKKDVVLEDDDVECTLIERKVLALGTNHPYLCHLFATFQTDSHLFFVMEYLNGGDLMFHIQQSGRFPESRAQFYAAEIVSGLKFLHKRGIVYRDLKLDNILLDYEGHVRIADFGMCKLQIYLEKTADTFCGTPDYMAPEIIKGLKYNQTVDWWSFGVLLYEMLIGQSPFSGCDEDELFWSICNEMPSYPRFLSQEALTILTRLLDKDARTRLGGTDCMHGDVRDQQFFHSLHWDKLERRELDAPFKPRVRHPLDTQYFDRAFTGERPRLTAVEPHVLRSMDQEPFRGFSYTNPNATDR